VQSTFICTLQKVATSLRPFRAVPHRGGEGSKRSGAKVVQVHFCTKVQIYFVCKALLEQCTPIGRRSTLLGATNRPNRLKADLGTNKFFRKFIFSKFFKKISKKIASFCTLLRKFRIFRKKIWKIFSKFRVCAKIRFTRKIFYAHKIFCAKLIFVR